MAELAARAGSSIAGYQLSDCLGHSTHTAVYRASGRMASRWALKVLSPELDPYRKLADRLGREAEILSRLDHPSIPPIYETGRDEVVTFATVPLVEATPLADLMGRGELTLELAWGALNQIADALDRAHRRGLSHRSLKPSNVLLDGSGRAYLAEFGITSPRRGPLARASPGYQLRYPQYLAPEQIEGREPGAHTDVYATGVLVFEILTGAPLYPGGVGEVLRQTLESPVPSAHARAWGLPPEIDAVLGRALAKDPQERQRTALELLEDLAGLPEPGANGGGGAALRGPPSGGRPAADSSLATLKRMGLPTLESHDLPVLNSFCGYVARHARAVAGDRADLVLELSGLERFLGPKPPPDGAREGTPEEFSRLADAFERAFGSDAPTQLSHLGRAVAAEWMRTTQPKPFRMMGRASSKVSDTLLQLTASLDRVRGEELHVWKQVDRQQFWVVHYDNLLTHGRRKPTKACHFWIAAYEAALRWGGLANDWVVEEAECACVTGAGGCVFTLERVGTR